MSVPEERCTKGKVSIAVIVNFEGGVEGEAWGQLRKNASMNTMKEAENYKREGETK